ncbi:uncharacterized protein [Patagioenas fasciata]|uniref:uncharacterized protein isoform X1 n=1 Tax=Patagioenas fasciata TaxID=372321 RepID=UPI003A9A520B
MERLKRRGRREGGAEIPPAPARDTSTACCCIAVVLQAQPRVCTEEETRKLWESLCSKIEQKRSSGTAKGLEKRARAMGGPGTAGREKQLGKEHSQLSVCLLECSPLKKGLWASFRPELGKEGVFLTALGARRAAGWDCTPGTWTCSLQTAADPTTGVLTRLVALHLCAYKTAELCTQLRSSGERICSTSASARRPSQALRLARETRSKSLLRRDERQCRPGCWHQLLPPSVKPPLQTAGSHAVGVSLVAVRLRWAVGERWGGRERPAGRGLELRPCSKGSPPQGSAGPARLRPRSWCPCTLWPWH